MHTLAHTRVSSWDLKVSRHQFCHKPHLEVEIMCYLAKLMTEDFLVDQIAVIVVPDVNHSWG